ncbi:hypothetical protein Agub_g14106, partial [Astrephomene gubernaculifera]
ETAISSSLSHPNIVQTYTYAVLPVKGETGALDTPLGPGASVTLDSTSAFTAHPPAYPGGAEQAGNVHSWEVRLVLEYCDRGSLRDVLSSTLAAAAAAAGGGAGAGGPAAPGPAAAALLPAVGQA